MIQDGQVKADIARQWISIKKLEEKFRAEKYIGGDVITEYPGSPAEAYNLLLVLAYASLDEVLSQCIVENVFQCRSRAPLGEKIRASENALPWDEFSKVEKGKEARNDLAHESKIVSREDCLKYVGLVRKELIAWGVIDEG